MSVPPLPAAAQAILAEANALFPEFQGGRYRLEWQSLMPGRPRWVVLDGDKSPNTARIFAHEAAQEAAERALQHARRSVKNRKYAPGMRPEWKSISVEKATALKFMAQAEAAGLTPTEYLQRLLSK